MDRNLNIITLNIPYPPDYGGMIDSFYRIKALHSAGIRVHLHCFEYDRPRMEGADKFCSSVTYYKRRKSLSDILTAKPYIVSSRSSGDLLSNLTKNDYPILYDGLHTTFTIDNPQLSKRRKFVRAHNIEHKYYETLSLEEKNSMKSMFYTMETAKLTRYEKIFRKADNILCISEGDLAYFKPKFSNTILFEPWHPFEKVICQPGTGKYVLFHADLSVPSNTAAAEFLCSEIAPNVNIEFVLAGKNPPPSLLSMAVGNPNTRIIPNPSQDEMTDLIINAQVNIAIGKNSNGFRLRLIYSLLVGRHCIANHKMLAGIGLEDHFTICDTPENVIANINKLASVPFTPEMVKQRESILGSRFSNYHKTEELIKVIFG